MDALISVRQNLAVAVELHEAGLAMMRQTIARTCAANPALDLDTEWRRWLYRETDAIPGDVDGPVRIRPYWT